MRDKPQVSRPFAPRDDLLERLPYRRTDLIGTCSWRDHVLEGLCLYRFLGERFLFSRHRSSRRTEFSRKHGPRSGAPARGKFRIRRTRPRASLDHRQAAAPRKYAVHAGSKRRAHCAGHRDDCCSPPDRPGYFLACAIIDKPILPFAFAFLAQRRIERGSPDIRRFMSMTSCSLTPSRWAMTLTWSGRISPFFQSPKSDFSRGAN